MAEKRAFESPGGSATKKPRFEGPRFRFAVHQYAPGIIIGKGGCTVKQIKEEAQVNVSVGDKVEGFLDRIIVITGEPANTAKAIMLISQAILDANQTASEEKQVPADVRILVHTRQAGTLIGKGGVAIKQLMADSGARIRVSNETLAGSTDKACEIKGTPEQIEQACALVLEKVQAAPLPEGTATVHYLASVPAGPDFYAPPTAGFSMSQAPSPYGALRAIAPAGAPAQFAQFELTIPAALGGSVIGKGGQTVKSIKQATSCNVSVGDSDAETQMRVVTIKGSSDRLPEALGMVRGALEQFEEGVHTLDVSISAHLAGTVIGKGGKAVAEMKGHSGCVIKVNDPDPQVPETRTVTITGSNTGVQIAAYLVQLRCTESAAGSSDSSGPGMTVAEVVIPNNVGPLIIGPRGATIEGIKAQTGCSISVKNAAPGTPDTRLVVLKGSPEAIEAAKASIAQFL